jgi:hypothetical protein
VLCRICPEDLKVMYDYKLQKIIARRCNCVPHALHVVVRFTEK